MKRIFVALLCLAVIVWPIHLNGRQKVEPVKVESLRTALSQLVHAPNDPSAQARYLELFPRTYNVFLQLFEPGQPLYDGHDYVEALSPLAKTHEEEIGKLLVTLSKDAHYDADAPAYLQSATSLYGSEHTQIFLSLLKGLPPSKQENLIAFLADVANHDAYPEYQIMIDHLKGLGETALAKKFELARTKRSRQPHD